MAKKALLIIDVQNDFCPGGALAVTNGDEVVEPINMMTKYAVANRWLIVPSKDWHPSDHISFKEQGGPWPPHCVQNTPGARFHHGLNICTWSDLPTVLKGFEQKRDCYSGFGGLIKEGLRAMTLTEYLQLYEVDTVYVCGLATDYCVKTTALDAVREGFKTYLLWDACQAVNVNPVDDICALKKMDNAGVELVTTDEVIHGQ